MSKTILEYEMSTLRDICTYYGDFWLYSGRYKGIRAPHKVKSAVSGCVRECAEAQSKDFGFIATETGYTVFVGGNGGITPVHAQILETDCSEERAIQLIDRFFMFYIRTADRLQRTAPWLQQLPGGLAYLKEVIVEDKLGICDSLEKEMQFLVDTYKDEWREVVENPARREQFRDFVNHPEEELTGSLYLPMNLNSAHEFACIKTTLRRVEPSSLGHV
eukprot:1184733-Prorocentrum_minimum.AAC.2